MKQQMLFHNLVPAQHSIARLAPANTKRGLPSWCVFCTVLGACLGLVRLARVRCTLLFQAMS